MEDFIFWLKNLPDDSACNVWYPVGSLAEYNVKTSLITRNIQALVIPLDREPKQQLPSHFLNPTIVHKDNIGTCLQLTWNRFGNSILFEFIDDLLRTTRIIENPVDCFLTKLNVWRELFDREGLLTLNKTCGLWGELFICCRSRGLESFWTGPSGSDIDFRSQSVVFDVKTTRAKNEITFSVSGLQQFDHKDKDIFVVWMRIETGTESDDSIADLLRKIDKTLLLPIVKNDLEKLLNTLPYSAVNDITFVCREIRVFSTGDLPLISKSLLENIYGSEATRIGKLSYQINASGVSYKEIEQLIKKILL